MRRLHLPESICLLSALGLAVVLSLDWFGLGATVPGVQAEEAAARAHLSGWGSLGWFMVLLLVLLMLGGIAVAATAALRRSPTLPMASAVVTWSIGSLVWFILLFVLINQPDLGIGAGDRMVSVKWPAYAGLVLAALIPIGAYLAMRDERTDAPESAYEPPPPRTIPRP
jgi:uncharacterized membrane protein YidH (DUF202 family)